MDIFKGLDDLINCLISKYEEFNDTWKRSNTYSEINLKKCQVADIENQTNILDLIWDYCSFLESQQYKLLFDLSQLQSPENKIHARIKQANSIQNKIKTYMAKDTAGKVPINKCFNDLLGIRSIIDSEFSFEELKSHVNEDFNSLKIINSSKNGYNAYHIYFKIDNKTFPWELQVWKKSDEKDNLQSHATYKQEYTTWEQKHKNT